MSEPVELAHSTGPGSGRFLYRSLVDSLHNRISLADVSQLRSRSGTWVEFAFTGDQRGMVEIIRCRLGADDIPETVSVWLRVGPCADVHAHPDQARLKEWLTHTHQISAISTDAGCLRLHGEIDTITLHHRVCATEDSPPGSR